MALIKCNDCGTEVSDKAYSCLKCGSPIAGSKETQGAGVQITTVQETSKKLKLQLILSVVVIVVCVAWIMNLAKTPNSEEAMGTPAVLIFFAIIWLVVTKFRVWWHHK